MAEDEDSQHEATPSKDDEWYYQEFLVSPEPGVEYKFLGPISTDELRRRLRTKVLDGRTPVRRAGETPVPAYSAISLMPRLTPSPQAFAESRKGCLTTILSGANNCGKSLALKVLRETLGPRATILLCDRFAQVDAIQTVPANRDEDTERQHEFQQFCMTRSRVVNSDDNHTHLAQLISRFKNSTRRRVFELCGEIVGGHFSIESIDPDNEFSSRYVSLDGFPLSSASAGTRLTMTLVAACMDSRFDTLLIDEPEIGLSPSAQAKVARYMLDPDRRRTHFPHLKRLYVATHSHLFLDRGEIGNNFRVTRNPDAVMLTPVASMAEFHQLQFNMLGNELESMFLPSAVVMVEGPSDYAVIGRALRLRYPGKRITVIDAGTESEMDKKMKILADWLGDVSQSPYRQRIFFALDAVISIGKRGTRSKLEKLGAEPANIVQWSKNGIEYYYPDAIVRDLFGCGVDGLAIEGDWVTGNQITKTKVGLAADVAGRLTPESRFGQELEEFLGRVASAGG